MSLSFYALEASDELASSQFGGISATPSLFAGRTKQSVFGARTLVQPCAQRSARCCRCDLTTMPAGTAWGSGKVSGLLTSGRLFHRCHARQLTGRRAQNTVISKQSRDAAIMARMPAPQFKISIYSSSLSTSHHSSCPSARRLSCFRFDVISSRLFPSLVLSLLGLSPRSIRSSSFRSSSVHSSSVFSSPCLGVSVYAS